ncbi:MAG: LamG domain-containing protein, partial [Clostridia bacterium]|nr:LamG domain-containing protein [Clostridia bacterium]
MKCVKSISVAFMIMLLFVSVAIPVVSAGNGNGGNGNGGTVKTNAELAEEELSELQNGNGNGCCVKAQNGKSNAEKNLFKYKIEDLNEELVVEANLDSSTIICGKTQDGNIKLKDLDDVHKLRDIRIAYSDLVGIAGVADDMVKITHFDANGEPDAVWIQEITNDGGYAYLEDVPFSEVIVGGALGTYTKTGTVTYQTSENFALGSTFEADKVNTLSATVTPVYEEDSPYDIPTDGLVGFWKFDENTGTNVSDSSGNGNHGTASGGMTWTDGKYNGAGSFDGVNDAVVVLNNPAIYINESDFSISTTVKIKSAKENTIMSKGSTISSNNGFVVGLDSTGKRFVKLNDGTLSVFANIGNSLNLNQSYNIVYVFDRDGYVKTYIDGILDGQVSISSKSSSIYNPSSLLIGSYDISTFGNLDIDNIMLYNKTLSESEIKQIYYDSIRDLKLKTNSNVGYSDEINESGTVSIPYDSEDSDITSLTAYVPETVTISGVTVRDYTNTVTPFEVMATVGYTEDPTLITETLTDESYQIVIRHTPSNDYMADSTVVYTSDT